MKSEPLETQLEPASYCPRWLQIAVAIPSILLWTFLAGMSFIWYAGVGVSALMGRLPTGDWRGPYLAVLCLLTLVCAGGASVPLRQAFEGRSRLRWLIGIFGLGLVFFVALGIVGD